MRKVLVSLLVLALCAPAIADVTIKTAPNGSSLDVLMDVTGDTVVRGVALNVALTSGSLADLTFGKDNTDPGLNTFIDYLYANGTGEVAGETPAKEGHPYADAAGPGVAVVGATEFSICVGALDASGAQGGIGAGTDILIATVNMGSAEGCITEDGLRGGIVGDSLGVVTLDPSVCFVTGGQECVKATASFYADWVAFGKPDCWCYRKHCRGDANGANQSNKQGSWAVGTDDLDVFLPAWQVMEAPAGPGIGDGICADFAHDAQSNKVGTWRVGTNDLDLFLVNWQVFDPAVADCPADDFNFWTN